MLQAGPLLLKNGEYMDNTENIKEYVLNMPPSAYYLGTDDNRSCGSLKTASGQYAHVGATIEETRKICRWLGSQRPLTLTARIKLSLVEWETPLLPLEQQHRCGASIPYGVLIFREVSESETDLSCPVRLYYQKTGLRSDDRVPFHMFRN
jgi:hypothetical protein